MTSGCRKNEDVAVISGTSSVSHPRVRIEQSVRFSRWNFPLDSFYSGFDLGKWIEMVISLDFLVIRVKILLGIQN